MVKVSLKREAFEVAITRRNLSQRGCISQKATSPKLLEVRGSPRQLCGNAFLRISKTTHLTTCLLSRTEKTVAENDRETVLRNGLRILAHMIAKAYLNEIERTDASLESNEKAEMEVKHANKRSI